jgi:hypothetical protein
MLMMHSNLALRESDELLGAQHLPPFCYKIIIQIIKYHKSINNVTYGWTCDGETITASGRSFISSLNILA